MGLAGGAWLRPHGLLLDLPGALEPLEPLEPLDAATGDDGAKGDDAATGVGGGRARHTVYVQGCGHALHSSCARVLLSSTALDVPVKCPLCRAVTVAAVPLEATGATGATDQQAQQAQHTAAVEAMGGLWGASLFPARDRGVVQCVALAVCCSAAYYMLLVSAHALSGV